MRTNLPNINLNLGTSIAENKLTQALQQPTRIPSYLSPYCQSFPCQHSLPRAPPDLPAAARGVHSPINHRPG